MRTAFRFLRSCGALRSFASFGLAVCGLGTQDPHSLFSRVSFSWALLSIVFCVRGVLYRSVALFCGSVSHQRFVYSFVEGACLFAFAVRVAILLVVLGRWFGFGFASFTAAFLIRSFFKFFNG